MRLKSSLRQFFGTVQRVIEQRQHARRPGVLQLQGLQGKVEVLTDTWGVPHIYASCADDLFFAQGYITARDRLFQLDYNRHGARGRLCELVGRRKIPWRDLTIHLKERTTYDVDVMLRTFGLERAAQAAWAEHSPEAQAILKAYAAGVNAYLASKPRPLEHQLLRLPTPAPWSEIDSLVLGKAIAFELNFAWRAILFGAMLTKVPNDIAQVLWPHFPVNGSCIVSHEAWEKTAQELAATREAAYVATGMGNAAGVGSNSFAVASSHTLCGQALLANDTHLQMQTPVPWYEVYLHGGGFDLHGFSLAGMPGIAIGRTPHHSWGITAGLVQDLDLFVERLHPKDPTQYLAPEGWMPLQSRRETFVIRGEGAHDRTFYESRHGSLLETASTYAEPEHRFAACWTGQRPSRDVDALLMLWKARTLEDCGEAAKHIVCPTFNIISATATGRVGYFLAGAIPHRRPGTPLRPLEGWTGEWDWYGVVPPEHNPRQIDPACGFVVTANNRVAPHDCPYELGTLFEPPNRFDRITERLHALGNNVTFQDMTNLQLDTFSRWGIESRDALLSVVGGLKGLLQGRSRHWVRQAAEQWVGWDGDTSRHSIGACIGILTALNTGREVVQRLAGDDAAWAFLELGSFIEQSIIELPKVAPRLQDLGIDLAEMVRVAFDRTLTTCRKEMGPDPKNWRWGKIHQLVGVHRFSGTSLGAFFSLGPEPADGAPDTVNRGDMNSARSCQLKLGAAMRMVVNAQNRDMAGTIIPGGQSGDRLSRHYDDQLRDFLTGKLKPAPVSREAIQVAFKEEFVAKQN